jgi:hypothetical protein
MTFGNTLGWGSPGYVEAGINHKAEGGERLVVRRFCFAPLVHLSRIVQVRRGCAANSTSL